MFKKAFQLFVILMTLHTAVFAYNDVFVNGRLLIESEDVLSENNRLLVPLRIICEETGAEVEWEEKSREIKITSKDDIVIFAIGSNEVKVNGESKNTDTAPRLLNNKTYVPLRTFAEAFGYEVGWEQDAYVISEKINEEIYYDKEYGTFSIKWSIASKFNQIETKEFLTNVIPEIENMELLYTYAVGTFENYAIVGGEYLYNAVDVADNYMIKKIYRIDIRNNEICTLFEKKVTITIWVERILWWRLNIWWLIGLTNMW